MGVSWLKTGAESTAIAKQEEQAAQLRKETQGEVFRFWMNLKEPGVSITFVDGALNEQGFLEPARFYEHDLFLNNKWGNRFVCPQKTVPHEGHICPLCAQANTYPYLASAFTIIDHRTFKSKKNEGKEYSNTRKLFVAKPGTMELLNQIAVKRGGLAGCRFDVMRIGDKAPNVGTAFDFTDKTDVEVLKKKYTQEITDPKTNEKKTVSLFVPYVYDEVIKFRTGEELVQMGFGSPAGVSGYGNSTAAIAAADKDETDYESQL